MYNAQCTMYNDSPCTVPVRFHTTIVCSDSQRTGARDIIQTCLIRNHHRTSSAVMSNRPQSFSIINKFRKPWDTIDDVGIETRLVAHRVDMLYS